MKRYKILGTVLLIGLLIFPAVNVHAQNQPSVVRAVLFYSPTCGHCEYVITGILLPMIEDYGDQLQIIGIDVTQQQGQALFISAMQKFNLESVGVPFLVIDNMYLVGSTDIPDKFPGLVETYLAQGGVDWPEIPGLTDILSPTNTSENTPEPTATPIPVTRAVLFYRSACSHCQKVVEEVIPPLFEKYGNQLEIFGIDVSKPEGDALYDIAIERFKIDRFGVPTLIMGDYVLVGGTEIEGELPGIIEGYFDQGGIDWPDIAGLPEAILKARMGDSFTAVASTQTATVQSTTVSATVSLPVPTPTATPGIIGIHTETPNWRDKFASDLAGNTLSVFVLLGMIGAVVWAAFKIFKNSTRAFLKGNWVWITPLLCVIGLGVAGYLAYIETTNTTAVCGPVGDCNTVQQSEYARLFGILPIGVLGLIGYVAILAFWLVARYSNNYFVDLATISLFTMTAFGTLFSIYLTFLEPFVIGATCAWCLTSAILMTTLMLLSVGPAKQALMKDSTSPAKY